MLAHVEHWVPWLLRFWKWITRRRPPKRREPTELLRIVSNEGQTWWSAPASIGGKPAIQVLTQWFVTNQTDFNVRLVKARFTRYFPRPWIIWPLRRPKQVTHSTDVGFMVDYHGIGDALPARTHADMRAGFFPLGDAPADIHQLLVGVTTFVDHLGNEYHHTTKIRHVQVRHVGDEQPR